MRARTTMLCVGIAASLALCGFATAQSLLAVTSPANTNDVLDAPLSTGPALGDPVRRGFSAPPVPAIADDGKTNRPDARELPGNPLWAIPLKSLTFTRDRPLFTPSRRPPPPPAAYVEPPRPVVAAKPAEPERPQLALIGVVIGKKEGIAVFLDQSTREVIRLRKNQGHGGWILRSLQGREATLEKAPTTVVLALPALDATAQPGTRLPGLQPGPTTQQAEPQL